MADTVIATTDLAPAASQVGDERHTPVTFVDFFRSVLLRKVAGLGSGDLSRRLGPSAITLDHCADLDATVERGGRIVSMRWILVHVIEEYARQCGHADLLRESIDGQTGD